MEIITNESPNEIIYYRDKLYEQFLFYFIYFLTLSFYIEGLRRSQTWTETGSTQKYPFAGISVMGVYGVA